MDRGLLIGLLLPRSDPDDWERDIDEMTRLADTAGIKIIQSLQQPLQHPHPGHYTGKGFASRIAALVEQHELDVVVVNDDLSPAQGATLEDFLGCRVLDRTQLILEIFALRAASRAGKLQVELASLKYALPRLKGQGESMSRLAGGIGTRGPGETRLEADRRRIRKRISDLEGRIEDLRVHHQEIRKGREGTALVSLVGYTNAGKSTLLNAFSGAGAYTEDRLFATLDPKLGRLELPSGTPCLLADTVGFIRHLPHQLVAAFRATLDEVTHSDVLIHVIDVSHPDAQGQLAVVRQVLHELGADGIPVVGAFNKTDRLSGGVPSHLRAEFERSAPVSALKGTGLDELREEVDQCLAQRRRRVRVTVPFTQGEVLARIHNSGRVLSEDYGPEGVKVEAELDWLEAERVLRSLDRDSGASQ